MQSNSHSRDSRTAFWTTSKADAPYSGKSLWCTISNVVTWALRSEQVSNTVHMYMFIILWHVRKQNKYQMLFFTVFYLFQAKIQVLCGNPIGSLKKTTQNVIQNNYAKPVGGGGDYCKHKSLLNLCTIFRTKCLPNLLASKATQNWT